MIIYLKRKGVNKMNAFARYFLQLFSQIWEDIKRFFKGFINLFVGLWNNFKRYFEIMTFHSADYGLVGWILVIFVNILFLALFVLLAIRLHLWLRKYLRFRKIELEKESLLMEIGELNYQVSKAIDEKNKIMAMKVSQLGLRPGEDENHEVDENESRFTKLIDVDLKYQNVDTTIHMTENDMVDLPTLIEKFIYFACSELGLYYDPHVVALFFSAMATSKIIILEGISGTGKTSLPYAMSKFFKNDASIIPVQPAWRDRAELVGYLNEFTKKFNETDFLKVLYDCLYREDINLLVLDEMNLARIEYYFAEFLSILEIPDPENWLIDLVPNTLENDPKLLINGKIKIPKNLWFIGTANKDDSTFTITDKVYDRAIAIEFKTKSEPFTTPPGESLNMSYEYLDGLFKQAQEQYMISEDTLERFKILDDFMIRNLKLTFGNRIMKQIYDFVPVYIACGGDEYEALDFLLTYKVLRKLENLNILFLKEELLDLIDVINQLFGEGNFAESIAYINQLIKSS